MRNFKTHASGYDEINRPLAGLLPELASFVPAYIYFPSFH